MRYVFSLYIHDTEHLNFPLRKFLLKFIYLRTNAFKIVCVSCIVHETRSLPSQTHKGTYGKKEMPSIANTGR